MSLALDAIADASTSSRARGRRERLVREDDRRRALSHRRPARRRATTRARAEAVNGDVDLDAVDVPRDLCRIRAYVRWEEAGKPNETTEEWREAEFAAAVVDLKREVASGVTLNDIRRRYGQPIVDGDDEPRRGKTTETTRMGDEDARASDSRAGDVGESNGASTSTARESARGDVIEKAPSPSSSPPPPSNRRGRDLRALLPTRANGAAAAAAAAPSEPSLMARWRAVKSDDGEMMIGDSLHPLADGELLVQVYEQGGRDEEAMSGPRRKVTGRRVVLTTNALEPLICHWGVAREEPGEWILAPPAVRPANTEAVSHMSCETQMEAFTGCFPTDRVSTSAAMDEADAYDECAFMQRLAFDLPGDGPDELMGLQFVFRNIDGNAWFKDTSNGNANYRASCVRVSAEERVSDELVDTIVRAEAGGSWWSLMHRFNLARSLLEKYCAQGEDEVKARNAAAKIFVWLRYSSTRQLTWQRNYNVKPRELSSAQSRLTHMLAELYVNKPHLRDMARLMLSTVGKGGDGGQGQQIRDEILNIMHRNDIKEVKGIWMEEWHQKLHNNTTPDDIVICSAYLDFLRADGDLSAYWNALAEGGVTKQRLESFERPVRSEPMWRPHIKEALIRDFENYLKILKSVHSGADLVESYDACKHRLDDATRRAVEYVVVGQSVGNIFDVVNACLDARHGLRDAGLANPSDSALCRDLLYLDLSIADASNRAIQRGSDAVTDCQSLLELTDMVLEDLCLSLPSSNDDLLYSLISWRRIRELQRDGDASWALRAKATTDRARLAITEYAAAISDGMQPAATTIGKRCDCDTWTIDLFSEEVIRGGPAFALSLVLTRLDMYLRREANMGDWQIISPATCAGEVMHVKTLAEVMNETFKTPTVLVCDHVGGDEEIPWGALAVLTSSSVDVLSHSAVRARNGGVLFATCYEPTVLDAVRGMDKRAVKLKVTPEETVAFHSIDFSSIDAENSSTDACRDDGSGARVDIQPIEFGGEYAVCMEDFNERLVGAKARNTKSLRDALTSGGIPDWISLPKSIAIPFGTFEHVLASPENASQAATMAKLMREIDDSTGSALETSLRVCRRCVRTVVPPPGMLDTLADVMRRGGLTPPADEETWELAWKAICDVWASKWNERAFVSIRNRGLNFDNLRMSILVQPVIDADHAFVIHTVNPSTNAVDELYAEVVQGMGETLVGNYPGRALSFTVKKSTDGAVSPPKITGFPSKNTILRVPHETLIFRSDSNGEDLEGYAGAGLYESVLARAASARRADYASDALVWDRRVQNETLSAIARAGVAVERALDSPQDIEGCVRDGVVYVVQTRPQV